MMTRVLRQGMFLLCVVTNVAMADEMIVTTFYPSRHGKFRDLWVTEMLGIGTRVPVGRLTITGTKADPFGGLCAAGFDWYDENMNGTKDNGECEITGLVVASNGNIGIGTPTPKALLHIVGEDPGGGPGDPRTLMLTYYGSSSGNYPRLIFERARGSVENPTSVVHDVLDPSKDDELGLINFRGYHGAADQSFTNGASVRIRAEVDGPVALDDVPGRLVIETHGPASGGGVTTERMRINSQGHVGIGTTNPDSRLQIEAQDSGLPAGIASVTPSLAQVSVLTNDAQAADKGAFLGLGGSVNDGATTKFLYGVIAGKKENNVSGDAQGYLAFYTGSVGFGAIAERVRINSQGNVGVGTQAPASRLDVNGLIRGEPECRTVSAQNPVLPYVSTATCAADEWLLTGGGECEVPGAVALCGGTRKGFLHASHPSGNSWSVDCYSNDWSTDVCSRAYAVCCKKGSP